MIAGRSHVWKMQKQPFLVRMGGSSILGEGGIKIFRTGGYRFWGYFCSIQKVLEQLWRYFTFLKLCKCSWMLHPLPTVASTPIGTKTKHHWFLSSSSTPHTLIGTTPIQEGQRKSFPAPRFTQENPQLSPHHLIPNQHQKWKKTKSWIHPPSSFPLVIPEAKRKLIY